MQGRTVTVHEAAPKKSGDASDGRSATDATGRTREQLLVAAADRGARRDVRDAVCPLWQVPYAAQLATKREKVEEALRNLTKAVVKNCKRAPKGTWRWPAWIAEVNRARGRTAAPVEGIVRSPVLEGYRNKSEFSIGPDADGVPTVGFNVGLFKEGITAVASPEECRHISPAALTLAAAMQAHLRTEKAAAGEEGGAKTALPVWDKRRGAGFWRLLTVREGGLAPPTGAWSDWLRVIPASGSGASGGGAGGSSGVDTSEDEGLTYPQPRAGSEVLVLVQVGL